MMGLHNASELLYRVLWCLCIRAMEFLWRAMDNAIDPRPVLSYPAEAQWINWLRNGKTGPEPALENKDDFEGAGVFSEKVTLASRAQMGLGNGGDDDNTVTDRPEEIMGCKWRNKSNIITPGK